MQGEFKFKENIEYDQQNKQENRMVKTKFENSNQQIKQTTNNSVQVNKECQCKTQKFEIEFQRILSQLILHKNEDVLLKQLQTLLQQMQLQSILDIENGPKIIFTTYQFIQMRKSAITRNYPFAPLNEVLNKLKKLIKNIKQTILQKYNLLPMKIEKINKKQQKAIKNLKKLNLILEEEQPTAFYDQISTSAFRPYKPEGSKQETPKNQQKPQPEVLKKIYFKPIILKGPSVELFYC